MISIEEYLDRYPKQSKRLIGIEFEQLQTLIQKAEVIHQEKQKSRSRLIQAGGGRSRTLSVKQEVLLTLIYLHQFPTFQMLGIQFGVSESTANNIFHYWVNILSDLLPSSLLEQIKKKESEWAWIEEILTEQELIVDSYEQPRERPSQNQEQKKYYSGKKAAHTFKNQLIVTPDGREIVDGLIGYPGPVSDISLWREQQHQFAQTQSFQGDKAYIGEVTISTPKKKPIKGKLTAEEKQENRKKAQKRIRVEHLIRLAKIFRIASERFRLNPRHYHSIISLVLGLVRYRIGAFIFT